ncbi:MAG: hypothetical protein J1G07_07075 [Clostridiales bacterium]|nr:hypothetical protein [Clostridiales bacterium]
MKKVYLIFICAILSIFFCGCDYIHHSNSFVEGTYTCEEGKLIVTAIDEETYKSRNGVNVVEDDSIERTNQYYEIAFFLYDEDSQSYVELAFYNLVQTSVKAQPCFYEDENGNDICPQKTYYSVQYVIGYDGKDYILN